jgi:cephalosporin hydroxylase
MDSQSSAETPQANGQATGQISASWLAQLAITRHGALANPGELATLLSILYYSAPRVILEIGTYQGGSAWAFGRLPSVSHIVTVDTAPQPEAAERLLSLPCRTSQVVADSTNPNTIHQVRAALDAFPPDVLFIDGDHLYKSARRDFDLYSPLVGSGGLIVLHDTQGYPNNPAVEVPHLWAELRQTYRTTELVDKPGGPGGTGIIWL